MGIVRFIFSIPALVVIIVLIAAIAPSFATWLLTNVLSVFGQFLQPLLVFGVVVYGLRMIFRGGKK